MKYPTIPLGKAEELAASFLRVEWSDPAEEVVWAGSGANLDLPNLDELQAKIYADWEAFTSSSAAGDPDLFEGRAAAALHESLRDLPGLVLDDPGFWRYLGLAFFWWLVTWREPSTFETGDPGKYLRYVDGMNPTECVLLRMFLRAQIALEDGDYSLAWAVEHGTDFWRSHILRVSVGSAPAVARALTREQSERRMVVSVVRPFARRLNRLATNVVLHVQDDNDAAAIIHELREDRT